MGMIVYQAEIPAGLLPLPGEPLYGHTGVALELRLPAPLVTDRPLRILVTLADD